MVKTLFGRLLSSYFVIILVTLLAIGYLLPYFFADYYFKSKEAELIRQGQKIGDVIVGDIFSSTGPMGMMGRGMMRGRISAILLDNMDDFLDARMTVVDTEGRVVISSAAESITGETKFTTDQINKVFKGEVVSRRGYSPIFKQEMMEVAVPIEKNHHVVGALILQSPISGMIDVISKVRWFTLYAAVAAVALAALIGYLLSRSISRPLLQMNRAARLMAQGNFNSRIPVTSRDEIGQLAETFNTLSASLNSTISALAMEKSKVESIISNMAEGVLAVDSNKKIVLVNESFRKIFTQKYPKLPSDLNSLDERVSQVFVKVLKSQKPHKTEFRLKDDVYLVYTSPIKKSNGEVTGAVGVFRDVTEMKKLDELRRSFMANVSHELKTPLTSIQGFTEALMDGLVKDKNTQNKYLKMIHEEALRLNRLTKEILDLLETDEPLKWKKQRLDITHIAQNAVLKLSPQADKKNIQLNLDTPGSVYVKANADRMEQVIINLVANALQFTPPKGKVTVKIELKQDEVLVKVMDTGVGIPPEELPHIWDRFYKVDKSRTRKETSGTGLGLSIVKGIVEACGGRVFAESQVGKGSIIGFVMPKD